MWQTYSHCISSVFLAKYSKRGPGPSRENQTLADLANVSGEQGRDLIQDKKMHDEYERALLRAVLPPSPLMDDLDDAYS